MGKAANNACRSSLGKEIDMIYRVKIAGALDQSWFDWLGDVKIISEPQDDGSVVNILSVNLADQSALFGIIDRIRDLNLNLIDVTREDG